MLKNKIKANKKTFIVLSITTASILLLVFAGFITLNYWKLQDNNTHLQQQLNALNSNSSTSDSGKSTIKILGPTAEPTPTPTTPKSTNTAPQNTQTSGRSNTELCSSLHASYIKSTEALVKPDSMVILRAIGTPDYDAIKADYNARATTFNNTLDLLYQQYLANASAAGCKPWFRSLVGTAVIHS